MERSAIHYCSVESPLGWLLVAGTGRGVCYLGFGDDPAQLLRALAAELPFARLDADPGPLAAWRDALLEHLRGERPQLEIPLDVRGSRFQRRVWSAIRAIPYGATRSYAELAAAVAEPGAARAVARACGANPVALLIPCHRVVASGGGLGGYRYGLARKRALLAAEGACRDAAADRGRAGLGPPRTAPAPA